MKVIWNYERNVEVRIFRRWCWKDREDDIGISRRECWKDREDDIGIRIEENVERIEKMMIQGYVEENLKRIYKTMIITDFLRLR